MLRSPEIFHNKGEAAMEKHGKPCRIVSVFDTADNASLTIS